ncbi:hypothetical protein VZT92_016845 [Zoarces viviparus]|uniref:Uncharacterized protein n=1 Tax=Zoarces viviparus TaxID=48416 RepID=A0AAW1EPC5_ZOAVI
MRKMKPAFISTRRILSMNNRMCGEVRRTRISAMSRCPEEPKDVVLLSCVKHDPDGAGTDPLGGRMAACSSQVTVHCLDVVFNSGSGVERTKRL